MKYIKLSQIFKLGRKRNKEIIHENKISNSSLIELAEKLYSGRDPSRGIVHVTNVRTNALMICDKLNINDINILVKIEAAALFHDLWDHKYIIPNSDSAEKIKNRLYIELRKIYFSDHDITDIVIIINNVSLSREINMRQNKEFLNLKHLQLMRDIVSDADKLEMLGLYGIYRMIEFEFKKEPTINPDRLKKVVIKVYNKKISKLLNENYIKTEPGRKIASPLMQEMDNYIKIIQLNTY